MKRNYKVLTTMVLCATIFCGCTFGNAKSFDNPDKDKLLIELITYVIDQLHFNPGDINDEFSENVYMNYIQGLDPYKRYFRKSDIEEFEKYKFQLDDQFKKSEITFFNLTHERLEQRIEEAKELYPKVLSKSFDFSKNETYNSDTEKLPYAKNKRELVERWRKQLKFSALSVYDSELKLDETKLKDDVKYKVRSKKELEKEARESVKKSITDNFDNLDDLERKDWFSVYLNAVVLEFDPHTFYFSPEDKDRFDTSMSGKLEGIGARLQKRNSNINIIEVISGGPAWRGNEVESGDIILKVRQTDENLPVDVVGMRLDDAVKLIKGPKGTQVELTLKKKIDGSIKNVMITRDVVELEEAYAKTSMVNKGNKKYGVINLPKFYIDFKDYGERNAATDVAKEIERLKKQGMDGLVLDLRGNGGGSLKTVVDMAGLFIKKGPIVQVKSTGERKEVLKDEDARIQWDGPLVILVNELSASASEILAAAMQDYKRAVIIGSQQTYGKGTVQNVVDLNRIVSNNTLGDVGAMKVTTQKFYRINGGSTQLEGVKSDVVVPDRYTYINVGEKDQDNPLPWDKIDAASYRPWNDYIDLERVVGSSKERMAKSNHFKLIDEQAKWISEQRDDSSFPLNYDDYLNEAKKNKEFTKRFEALSEYKNNLTFNSLPYEIEAMKKDSVLADKRERWHKALARDAYIEEALNVLEDLKIDYLNRKNRKLADINKG
ncbi:carboxy terminal-processing peptidase [Spongiivirga citrea]|uniref:Tail-specific protease n=1 Tax=Spongiivirga citrea TaxID=1481457 RepID=A0A6M0CKP9_9FLAO|nr:carboxy terminal-processing peptidase [Spongiivirga citrea]NER18222.1 tail-specific protease [Spongiivirga citrea]